MRYQDAGVNIDEADRAVSSIRKLARETFTRGVLTDIGIVRRMLLAGRMEEAGADQLGRRRRH